MIFFLKNNWRDKYNDSQLSKEERELVLAKIRSTKADARIKEAKAVVAERYRHRRQRATRSSVRSVKLILRRSGIKVKRSSFGSKGG